MIFLKYFQSRLKLLRESYDLSMTEFAELLMWSAPAAVNQFEKGKSTPSLETLLLITTRFGISMDWLTGLSDTPYTKDSITSGYKALAERQQALKADPVINDAITWYQHENWDRYRDKPPLTDELRGNIIFLTNATFLNDLEHKQEDCYITRLVKAYEPKSKRVQLEARKRNRYIQLLEYHLHGYEQPLYTIKPEIKEFRIE